MTAVMLSRAEYFITLHAARAYVRRGYTLNEVRETLARPEIEYRGSVKHANSENRRVLVKGDMAVVVDDGTSEVITVLHRHKEGKPCECPDC